MSRSKREQSRPNHDSRRSKMVKKHWINCWVSKHRRPLKSNCLQLETNYGPVRTGLSEPSATSGLEPNAAEEPSIALHTTAPKPTPATSNRRQSLTATPLFSPAVRAWDIQTQNAYSAPQPNLKPSILSTTSQSENDSQCVRSKPRMQILLRSPT
jgi:hypothetical protein